MKCFCQFQNDGEGKLCSNYHENDVFFCNSFMEADISETLKDNVSDMLEI